MNVPVPAPLQLGEKQEESFKTFKLQWGYYALATGITSKPAATQVAVLMSILGAEAMMLVEELELTAEEKSSTATILTKLEQKVTPKREKRTERSEFHTMVQQMDESIDDYVKRLKEKVRHCEYSDVEKAYELKEQFIRGILDRNLRKELLRDENLTLTQMVEKFKEEKKIEDLVLAYDRLHSGGGTGEGSSGAVLKVTTTKKKCFFCGESHSRRKEDCPAFGKKCIGCGKMNHFWKVCRNSDRKYKMKRKSSVRQVEEIASSDTDDSDAEESNFVDIFMVEKDVKPEQARIFVSLEVGSGYTKKLQCQADTGASVNIRSLEDLRKINPDGVISPTNVKLKCFGGQMIEPVGRTKLAARLKKKKESLEFIVVKVKQQPLLSAVACVKLGIIKLQNDIQVRYLKGSEGTDDGNMRIAEVNVVELEYADAEDEMAEITTETIQDTVLRKLPSVPVKGWPDRKDFCDELLMYGAGKDELAVIEGIISKGRSTRNSEPLKTTKMRAPMLQMIPGQIETHREKMKKHYDCGTKKLPELEATVVHRLPCKSIEVQTEEGVMMRRSGVYVKPFGQHSVSSTRTSYTTIQSTSEPAVVEDGFERVFDNRQYHKVDARVEVNASCNDQARPAGEDVPVVPAY